ncbi:MAG: hypothetical protein WBP16_00155 [Ferruginibacter sp.]
MKRRTFLLTASTVALAAVTIPVVRYYNKRSKYYDPIVMPDELSRFCEEKTLREIGSSYRKLAPQEKNKTVLKQLILTDSDGKLMATNDTYTLLEFLDSKIHKDFADNSIYVINGWIISLTEARQCALLSLT